MTKQKQRSIATAAAAALIFLLFFATRLYQLSSIPRGIHVDEAGMAFDALCLARQGTDRYGLDWPIYLTNYGSGQSALYAYLAAAAIRLLNHFSPTVFRLPAVLGGLMTLIFGMLILCRTLGRKAALAGGLLITICPYFLMASRWGLDCNLMLGFSVMSLYLLMTAASSGKKRLYALAGLSFGLTLYSYAIAFAALPVFLTAAGLWLLWRKRLTPGRIISFLLPLAVLAAPLLLFVAFNAGILEPFSTPFFSVPILTEYRGSELSLRHIPENLNIFYILFSHDFLAYNGFAAYGTLYYIAVPFFIIGLASALTEAWKGLRGKSDQETILVLFLFLTLLLTGLCMSGPNINRLNAIYFPLLYYTVKGLQVCGRRLHRLVPAAGICVFLVSFCFFAHYYYQIYPEDIYPQQYFNDSFISILDYIDEKFPGEKRDIYVDNYDDNVVHPYIYTLLRDPSLWNQWLEERQWDNSYGPYHFNLPDEVDENGIYIMYSNGIAMAALEQAGFTAETWGLWRIYWKN